MELCKEQNDFSCLAQFFFIYLFCFQTQQPSPLSRLNEQLLPSKVNQLMEVYSLDKKYLFDLTDPDTVFNPTQRSRIVHYILRYASNFWVHAFSCSYQCLCKRD